MGPLLRNNSRFAARSMSRAPWGLVIFPSGYLVLLSQDNSRAKLQDTREKLVVSLANASS